MQIHRQIFGGSAIAISLLLACAGSAAAILPDNRTDEIVSPIEKGGLSLLPNLAVPDAAGEHVVVTGGSKSALLSSGVSWMLETRTSTGWRGVQIGPSPVTGADFRDQSHVSFNGASLDFSRFAFQTWMPLDPRDSNHGMAEYIRNGPAGPLIWATRPPAPAAPISESSECEEGAEPFFCTTNEAVFAGASTNLEDVVWGEYYPLLAPPASLAGYPADTHQHGYEVYESVSGVPELTGLVPATSKTECGPASESCLVPACGAAMGNAGGAPFGLGFAPVSGAVSGDGSQVIFTSPDPVPYNEGVPGCAPPEVYVREKGTTTLDVSVSQKAGGDPNGPREKLYAGSSEEHGQINTVFFTSKEELTENANTGNSEGNDLYAYTLPTGSGPGRLTDLTPENNIAGASGGAEVTFLGASTSGKIVYFTASSQLTAEPNVRGQVAQSGVSNLYVYDATTGHTRFIAPGAGLAGPHIGLSYGETAAGRLTSEITPDGQHLVLVSSERLTKYDNLGPECLGMMVEELPVRQPGSCAEVYLYSAATGDLDCVSCSPSGAPPVGSARLPMRFVEGVFDGNLEPGTLQVPRAISDDGSRVFFSSPDRLTTEAPPPITTHGSQAGIAINWEYEPNVYEYEGGSIKLIAPAAVLLAATPSGSDVFFDTYSQLVPQDEDGSADVYDARVDGGFPALTRPACSGAACQGAPAAPTSFAAPPTTTIVSAAGNFSAAVKQSAKHCKKGFVIRKKKCVKRVKKVRTKRAGHRRNNRGTGGRA